VNGITGRELRSQPAARPCCRLSDFRPPQLSTLSPPLTWDDRGARGASGSPDRRPGEPLAAVFSGTTLPVYATNMYRLLRKALKTSGHSPCDGSAPKLIWPALRDAMASRPTGAGPHPPGRPPWINSRSSMPIASPNISRTMIAARQPASHTRTLTVRTPPRSPRPPRSFHKPISALSTPSTVIPQTHLHALRALHGHSTNPSPRSPRPPRSFHKPISTPSTVIDLPRRSSCPPRLIHEAAPGGTQA
jgi:hypothetical protein